MKGRSDSPIAPLEKAQVPRMNSTGGLTHFLQLERKAEFHASTGDEAWLLWWNSIGTPWSLSQLEENPEFPASTQNRPYFTQQLERNPEEHLTTRKETWLPWGSRRDSLKSLSELERKLKLPAATWKNHEISPSTWDEALLPWSALTAIPSSLAILERRVWLQLCNSRGSPRHIPQVDRSANLPVATQVTPRGSLMNGDEAISPHSDWRALPDSTLLLERRLDLPGATREVPWSPHHNSSETPIFPPQVRKTMRFPSQHEMRPVSSAVPWEESWVPTRNPKGGLTHSLYATQEVPWGTCCHSRGTPSFLPQLKKSPVFPTSFWDDGQLAWFKLRGTLTFPSHLKRRPVSRIESREEPPNSWHK